MEAEKDKARPVQERLRAKSSHRLQGALSTLHSLTGWICLPVRSLDLLVVAESPLPPAQGHTTCFLCNLTLYW